MTASEIIKRERECVLRAKSCDRNCGDCDLIMPEDEIVNAYNKALDLLEKQEKAEKVANLEELRNDSK